MQFYKEIDFKQTPIGSIPKDWNILRLSSIAEIIMGQSPPSPTYNKNGIGLPFLQGKMEFGSIYPSPVLFCSEPVKIAEAGDILLSVRAPVGDVNISPCKLCIGRGLAAIRFNRKKAINFFYFYFFQKIKRIIESLGKGSTFKAITKIDIEKLRVVYPPLEEQRGIVEVLSVVDLAIQKTDEIIAKTERLKRGLMQTLLTKGIGHKEFKETPIGKIPKTWKIVRVGQVCRCIVPGRNKPKKFDGDIPWITLPDINGMYIESSKTGLGVSEQEIKRCGTKIIPPNSVIMSCVGKFGIAAVAKRSIVINQQLHAFICPDNLDPYFLATALILQKNYMLSLAAKTTVPYLNKAKCNSILIPLPPFEEQQNIVRILKKVDEKIEIERKNKEKLERIKQGLMDLLLTGKIRIKVS